MGAFLQHHLAGVDAEKMRRQVLSRESSEHTVFDPWRELVRPFVDGLVRHSHGFGSCCDGSTEQFNGF